MHLTSAPVCVDGGSPMLLFRTKHVKSQRSRFYHLGASCQATRSIDHKKKKKLVRGQQHIYPIYSQLITRDQFDRWRTLKDVAKEEEKVTTSVHSFCTQVEVRIYVDTEDIRSKREEALSSK